MLTVQDDWVEYEALPVRRTAVRGGAACGRGRSAAGAAPSFVGVQPLALVTAPARRRTARAVPRRRLRLTRRGRFVLVVLPALLALSGSLLALSGQVSAEAATEPVAPVAARTVTVAPGESLWSIAGRIAPRADPRGVVAEIEAANGLRDGEPLSAGLTLVLPGR